MREIAPIATIVGLVAGVIGLVMGGYMSVSVTTLGWLTAAVWAEAILAGAFWYTVKGCANEKFAKEDFGCMSAMTAAFGLALGLLLMGLYIIYPFDNTFAAYLFYPTVGMISLGLAAVSLYILTFAKHAWKYQDKWGVAQAASFGVFVLMVAVIVGKVGRIIPISNEAVNGCVIVLGVAFVIAIVSVLLPALFSKPRKA